MSAASHKQAFTTLRSGRIVPGCECGWVGRLDGHALRAAAADEHRAHKQQPVPVTVRKVVAEHLGDDRWLVMDADGNVAEHPSAAAVVRSVRRKDAKTTTAGIHATLIDWRNVPAGFTPPAD